MRALVPDVSLELSRSGRDDGRARHHTISLDHSALGAAVRTRVREALGSLCAARSFILDRALRCLRQENPEWRSVVVRSNRYLNNIVEQDHRAIKRRCAPMLALKTFRTAAVTLAGVELAHRIRKRQFSFGRRGPRRFSSLKDLWARALARPDAETDRGKPAVV